ncbi:hypothetical protein V1512DRAFT_45719 [Lipomyces arxii]|uniref:uncharacterized protein n=1 Tax=Lipomyces arxii TaxID=56418 RepID=UPI0034CFB1A3
MISGSNLDRQIWSPTPPEPSSVLTHSSTSTSAGSGVSVHNTPTSKSVADVAETSRRDSFERDHAVPRKRVAIEVIGREIESSNDAADLLDTTHDLVVEEATLVSDSDMDASVDEQLPAAQLAAESESASADSSAGDIESNLTAIERIILKDAGINDDDAPFSTMKSFVTKLKHVFRKDDPQNYLLALNEYLENFLSLSDDKKQEFWKLGLVLFQQLPALACELWCRSNSSPEIFWPEEGDVLLVNFYKLFSSVAVYAFQQDYFNLKVNALEFPESFISGLYAQALSRIFTVSRDCILSTFGELDHDNYATFISVPLHLIDVDGIKIVAKLWDEVTKPGIKVNSKTLAAIVPHIDAIVTLSWTLYQCAPPSLPQSPDEDQVSVSSESTSVEGNTDNRSILTKVPIKQLLPLFVSLETSIGRMIESNDGPERVLLVSIIDKLSTLFYVLIQIPESNLINTHPATKPVLKIATSVSIADIHKCSYLIRKFYWWINMFRSPRAELKLFGIKKMTSDLNEFYRESNAETASIVTACEAVMQANKFTQYLTSTEAHSVFISQFATTIYTVLAMFRVITNNDLECLWKAMTESNSIMMFDSICSVFMQMAAWMMLDSLDWVLESLPRSIVLYEANIVKLIEVTVHSYIGRASQEEHDLNRRASYLRNPQSMLMKVIAKVCSLTGEEESNFKVSPREYIELASRCLEFLMMAESSALEKLTSVNESISYLVPFKPDSLQYLVHIHAYYESLREEFNGPISVEPWHPIVIGNIIEWYKYSMRHRPKSSIYDLEVTTRQYTLGKALLHGDVKTQDIECVWEALGAGPLNSIALVDEFWQSLAELANTKKKPCAFIEFCYGRIKSLTQDYLTASVVDFILNYIEYRYHIMKSDFLSEQNGYSLPGFDTLWHVYSRTPDEQNLTKQIQIAVWLFTESEYVMSQLPDVVEKCHRSLVRHCITSIEDAGKTVTVNTDSARTYRRSLQFLDSFLNSYRQHALHTCGSALGSGDDWNGIKGKLITVRLQWHACKPQTPVECISMGQDNTAQELYSRILDLATGSNFRLFVMGSELKTTDFRKSLKDVGFRDITPVMVVKRPQLEPEDSANIAADSNLNLLAEKTKNLDASGDMAQSEINLRQAEQELMDRFDVLYSLLCLPDSYASLAWSLMQQIGMESHFVRKFLDPSQTQKIWAELFPADFPFQCLYSDFVLQRVLDQYQQNQLDQQWVEKCHEHIVPELIEFAVKPHLATESSTEAKVFLRSILLSRAVSILRLVDSSFALCLSDEKLYRIVSDLTLIVDENSKDLSAPVIDFIFVSSMHDSRVWTCLEQSEGWKEVFQRCLLLTSDQEVKTYYGTAISEYVQIQIDQDSNLKSRVILYFWNVTKTLLPLPNKSEAPRSSTLFVLAEFLLRMMLGVTDIEFDETAALAEWYQPLTVQRCTESLFDGRNDNIIYGYSRLLVATIECRRDKSREINASFVSWDLLLGFLFTEGNKTESSEEAIGCVLPETRMSLYRIVMALSDYDNLARVVLQINKLFSQEGIFHDTWNNDRSRWLRSQVGFVGLQNLANTCYVNSFTNQLYMNEDFRNLVFMISEGEDALLIRALVELFGFMRYSWQKMVDPSRYIESIVDFENKPIDISVQMDVDEFYNLLFDRIEGQISDASMKEAIKKCYGGSLLTQIKSKECAHVSERTEAFSAIQCDIKGKQNLIESLNSYVEGETLDGDNKYWCSQCLAHVDAEKRICLKEVPNHLIFHLKRFDFDLQTMQRSKINELFEFPMEVDIEPYTFKHFANEDTEAGDRFRLVGILVHSGTAESGHYYSYIADKNATDDSGRWVEFNDAEVALLAEDSIASMCFGGGAQGVNGELMEKPYSAYMLFYDRVDAQEVKMSGKCSDELRLRIRKENEQLGMRWKLFGSEHVQFVRALYQRLYTSECKIEYDEMLFETFYQIVARTKDSREVEEYLVVMRESVTKEPSAYWLLSWLIEREAAMINLFVRCPNSAVRQGIQMVVLEGLSTVRGTAGYGSLESWVESLKHDRSGIACRLFLKFVELVPAVSVMNRAFDEYFTFLGRVCDLGQDELHMMIYVGMLHRSLAAVYDDRHMHVKPSWAEVRGERRKPSYRVVCGFILKFLRAIEVEPEYAVSEFDRVGKNVITLTEAEMLCRGVKKGNLSFLYRMLESECDVDQMVEFVEIVIGVGTRGSVVRLVRNTIMLGLESGSQETVGSSFAVGARMRSVFDVPEWKELARQVVSEIEVAAGVNGDGAVEFIGLGIENEVVREIAVGHVSRWAPVLLVNWSKRVRERSVVVLEEFVFEEGDEMVVKEVVRGCDEYVGRRYRSGKERVRADEMRFEQMCFVLQKCGEVVGEDAVDELVHELEGMRVLSDESVEWTSESDGMVDN